MLIAYVSLRTSGSPRPSLARGFHFHVPLSESYTPSLSTRYVVYNVPGLHPFVLMPASKAISDLLKLIFLANDKASVTPVMRSIPESSHSTESGPS